MYCPNCSSPLPNEVKFCTRCGVNLTSIAGLLNQKTVQRQKPDEIIKLMDKCHEGYLSIMIGLGLIITSLLIVIAALMLDVLPAALSGLLFLGWAIPAIAQGFGKWQSAKNDMRSIVDARELVGSVTERTTASLNTHA